MSLMGADLSIIGTAVMIAAIVWGIIVPIIVTSTRRRAMGKRGQETKYESPDAEYADITLRIRDARIHTVEAVEDRHTKMLKAQQERNKAEHLEWEIAAGGRPTTTWLLKPDRPTINRYQWDPEKHWDPVDPEAWRWRNEPKHTLEMAESFDRQAMEVVPQIENCAATVRALTEVRDRIDNPEPTGWERFIETWFWPILIWQAIRIVQREKTH